MSPDPKSAAVNPAMSASGTHQSQRSTRVAMRHPSNPSRPPAAAIALNADARLLAATLAAGDTLELPLEPARHYYLVPVNGAVEVGGKVAHSRDGIAITGEESLSVTAKDAVELVLVETR